MDSYKKVRWLEQAFLRQWRSVKILKVGASFQLTNRIQTNIIC